MEQKTEMIYDARWAEMRVHWYGKYIAGLTIPWKTRVLSETDWFNGWIVVWHCLGQLDISHESIWPRNNPSTDRPVRS